MCGTLDDLGKSPQWIVNDSCTVHASAELIYASVTHLISAVTLAKLVSLAVHSHANNNF